MGKNIILYIASLLTKFPEATVPLVAWLVNMTLLWLFQIGVGFQTRTSWAPVMRAFPFDEIRKTGRHLSLLAISLLAGAIVDSNSTLTASVNPQNSLGAEIIVYAGFFILLYLFAELAYQKVKDAPFPGIWRILTTKSGASWSLFFILGQVAGVWSLSLAWTLV